MHVNSNDTVRINYDTEKGENMSIKCGDMIRFKFVTDSRWGPTGVHEAFISYGKNGKLVANYLGELLVSRIKSDSVLYPHFDELNDLLTWCDEVEIIEKGSRNHDRY